MYERQRFVLDAEHTPAAFAELCRRYGISRKTGYKWLERYARLGPESLADASHRPQQCPHATSPAVIREILQLRRVWRWGARKLHALLCEAHPGEPVPAIPTIHRILVRHGRVRPRRRSRVRAHPGRPPTAIPGPNVVWSVDFKGQFKLGNGRYCYPLTVQDAYSRYLLACEGLAGPLLQPTQRVFRRLFRTYGLPERIRSDNGQPFASSALGRLSQLSVWWLRLGIRPELIEPASPHQNGRHERMHKDLKAAATQPPAPSFGAQQRRFDTFRHTFNEVRPHEALGQRRPAALYTPSARRYGPRLQPITYPAHFEIRRVATNGGIRWHKRWVNVSHILATLPVGLEPLASGTWNVFFGPIHLGWLDERDYCIHDRRGRAQRHLSPIR
jgi:transposase InsO family protein